MNTFLKILKIFSNTLWHQQYVFLCPQIICIANTQWETQLRMQNMEHAVIYWVTWNQAAEFPYLSTQITKIPCQLRKIFVPRIHCSVSYLGFCNCWLLPHCVLSGCEKQSLNADNANSITCRHLSSICVLAYHWLSTSCQITWQNEKIHYQCSNRLPKRH